MKVSKNSMKHKIPKQDLLKQADLVVYRVADETVTGIIISLHNHSGWWGGGYYYVSWNEPERAIYEGEVAYEEMHRWKLADIVKVFPAPNNI